MDAIEFARRFCVILLKRKLFAEESDAHYIIHREMQAYFPEVLAELTAKAAWVPNFPDPTRDLQALPATRPPLTESD